MSREKSKVELELEARIAACLGDEERVEVLKRTLRFKASWVELGEALNSVVKAQSWKEWGWPSFDEYCKKELHLRDETVQKLTGSFGFLAERAPDVFQDPYRASVPALESVDFWRRAEEGVRESGELKEREGELLELRRAVLEDGVGPQTLKRRFGEQFFPVSDEEQEERDRAALLAASKRLLALLESVQIVPRKLAKDVATEVEALVEALDSKKGKEEAA